MGPTFTRGFPFPFKECSPMKNDLVFHCKDGVYRGSSSLFLASSRYLRSIATIKKITPQGDYFCFDERVEISLPDVFVYQLEMLSDIMSTGSAALPAENSEPLKEIHDLIRIDIWKTTDVELLPSEILDQSNLVFINEDIEIKQEIDIDEFNHSIEISHLINEECQPQLSLSSTAGNESEDTIETDPICITSNEEIYFKELGTRGSSYQSQQKPPGKRLRILKSCDSGPKRKKVKLSEAENSIPDVCYDKKITKLPNHEFLLKILDGHKTIVENGVKVKMPAKKYFVTLVAEGYKYRKKKTMGSREQSKLRSKFQCLGCEKHNVYLYCWATVEVIDFDDPAQDIYTLEADLYPQPSHHICLPAAIVS